MLEKFQTKMAASWNARNTGIFIQLCVDQIYNNDGNGTTYTKNGWDNIIEGFRKKTGNVYTKKQFKNKLQSLKNQWKNWDKLFSKETGIAIDYTRNLVIAEDEWWERKIRENPEYERFRYAGLDYANELKEIFKDMASGKSKLAPNSLPSRQTVDWDEDGYRPTRDTEEGSGDSEDERFGATAGVSVGVSGDLGGMSLGTSTHSDAPTGSGSLGKRKRCGASNTGKKKKYSSTKQIADSFSTLVSTSKERIDAIEKVCPADVPAKEVMAKLSAIPEIARDTDFRARCCDVMMDPECRSMFAAIKDDKECLVEWLRRRAYNLP